MFSYEHEYGDKTAPIIFTIFMILVAIFAAHDFYTREKEEEEAIRLQNKPSLNNIVIIHDGKAYKLIEIDINEVKK